jgi:hypothetical protein
MAKLKRTYNEDGNLTHKQCGTCRIEQPISSFYKKGALSKTNIDGYGPDCIVCHKAKWHIHAANPEKRKRWLLERIRAKCKKDNIPFNITIEDLVIPSHCPILGMPLSFGVKKVSEYRNKKQGVPMDSPSVDRIVPELGYVKGNIVIVSYRANLIKTNATVSELIKVAEFYRLLTS